MEKKSTSKKCLFLKESEYINNLDISFYFLRKMLFIYKFIKLNLNYLKMFIL
jgi:hypothetical protein